MAQFSSTQRSGTILEKVREGMKIFDSEQKEVGKVKFVYFGAIADQPDYEGVGAATNKGSSPELYPNDSMARSVAELFTGSDDIPEELRSRLIHSGFIRIDSSGWFSRDAYAVPDQIDTIAEDRVVLKVKRDELIKY